MQQHCPNPLHQANNDTTKALCIFIPHIVPFKAPAHKSIVRHFNVIVQESHPLPLFAAHKPQRQITKLPVLSTQHLLDLHTFFNNFFYVLLRDGLHLIKGGSSPRSTHLSRRRRIPRPQWHGRERSRRVLETGGIYAGSEIAGSQGGHSAGARNG